jgi:hypothetical protein
MPGLLLSRSHFLVVLLLRSPSDSPHVVSEACNLDPSIQSASNPNFKCRRSVRLDEPHIFICKFKEGDAIWNYVWNRVNAVANKLGLSLSIPTTIGPNCILPRLGVETRFFSRALAMAVAHSDLCLANSFLEPLQKRVLGLLFLFTLFLLKI